MIRIIDNPRLLATLVGAILAAGLASLASIVRQEDPTITNGVALVITPYPGASAARVESLVTEPLEEELETIQEIQLLRSVSRAGISVLTVELDENILGDATAPVFSKVRDAVDDAKARFPEGVLQPVFDDERFGAYSLIYGVAARTGAEVDPVVLQRYAAELEDALRGVPGTDHVTVFGMSAERIRVSLDLDALDAAGLTSGQVADALARADAKGAAGVLRGPPYDLLIEVSGELDGLDRVRDVPLAVGREGAVLRVADVAEVERDIAEPAREKARVDGRPGLLIATQLAAGQRYDAWAAQVQPRVDRFVAGLPPELELHTVFDQTQYTDARLSNLIGNLLTGLVLVIGVLFATLGMRAALVVTAALPLTTLASIATLRFLDVPIQQMSVAGLIVALGLLVDNAIVVTDAVRLRRSRGEGRAEAVRGAVSHLAVPLFASTLTTVLAFMPILLLPGRVGEFVGTIGLSVIVALIASFGVALLVIAPLAGRAIPQGAAQTRAPGLVGRAFAASLDWSLRHPHRSMAVASLLPLLGFSLAGTLPAQFFPPADRDQLYVQVHLAPSASIEATGRVVRELDEILRASPRVEHVAWTIGRSAPPFYYNMLQNQDGNPAYAQALVELRSVADVARVFSELGPELTDAAPEAQVILRELLQGPPVEAPVELRLFGPRLETLRTLGEGLRARMADAPLITHTTASLTGSSPKLRVELSEVEALRIGLRPGDVAGQLFTQLEGVDGGSVLEATEQLRARVRGEAPLRHQLARLRGTPIRGRAGSTPLAALGEVRLAPALDVVPHRSGERVNVVRGYTEAGVFPEAAMAEVRAALTARPLELPAGYRLEVGGDEEKRGDALGDLFASVPVLVLLMVASVALAANSFRVSAVVFVVALQSMGFGLLSLAVLGHPLGFNAMIGLIGLVGVAINAAIVINSVLAGDPEACRGSAARVAHLVGTETSRHIVSTTITTFGGFLPLILAEGGFWPPFATAIAGGVLLASIGSFYSVPAAFLVLTRRRPLGTVEVAS